MRGSILVVGAGIAGQACALALEQEGLECTVIDQRDGSYGLGMGLNLPGNAVRVLDDLGVGDQVAAAGVPVRRREYRNGAGRLLFETDDAAFWRGVGSPLCVRHGHLLHALAGTRSVERGTRALLVQPDAGVVEIEGESELRHYDFVIGADGVHSAMRPAVAEGNPTPSAMTQSSWRFIVANPGVDCWTAWSGARGTCLMIPVDPDHVYGYAASTRGGETADHQWLADTFADFPDLVTRAVESVLSGASELHHSPVVEVRLKRWHKGRLVLVGDAAHATGPVWAQGVAMALEDATVLAELLARTQDWSLVGEDFERRRRARVDHAQAATDKFSRLARLPTWIRDLAAPALGPRAYREAYGLLRQPAT